MSLKTQLTPDGKATKRTVSDKIKRRQQFYAGISRTPFAYKDWKKA